MSTPNEIIAATGEASRAANSFLRLIEQFYRPYGIIREARAEATAAVIRAEGDVAALEIRQRTAGRFLSREFRRQENIDAVVEVAAGLLPPAADVQAPDEDWMSRFFTDAGDISDEQLRDLFARILAREVQGPGRCHRRTLTVLKDLEGREAGHFKFVAAHAWLYQREAILLTVDAAQGGVRFADLYALGRAGLADPDSVSLPVEAGSEMRFHSHRFSCSLSDGLTSAEVVVWPLTVAGAELARACVLDEPPDALEAGIGALKAQYVHLVTTATDNRRDDE